MSFHLNKQMLCFGHREACDVEKEQMCQSLKTLKEEHKAHVRDLSDAIEQTERKYEGLLEEVWQPHFSSDLLCC